MNYPAETYGVSEDQKFSGRSKLRGIGPVAIKVISFMQKGSTQRVSGPENANSVPFAYYFSQQISLRGDKYILKSAKGMAIADPTTMLGLVERS